jgi:hypothetical protein
MAAPRFLTAAVRTLPAAAALTVAMGCASLAPPFPVYATPGDLERLSGDWRGEYIGDHDHGRQGTIALRLMAGENHAHGTIVMIPAGLDQHPPASRAHFDRVLAIRFVTASDDTLSGAVEPYWDPDRRTRAFSTFRGRLTGDTIEGIFNTKYDSGFPETTGWWKVRRTRSERE